MTSNDRPTAGTVAFIGLGNLGAQLASCLVRSGVDVIAADLDPSRVESLVALGARSADDVHDAASRAEVVITCLPSPAAVSAVVEGPRGVLAALAGRGTWIDTSTTDHSEMIRLAELAAGLGVAVLEAPVTGGVHLARSGEITVLVGGEREVFERHRHVLEHIGSPVLHIGPIGSASVIKVITNMLAFVHLVSAGEALMLAAAHGLDLRTAFEAIRNSSGNSFVHETEGQLVLSGSYDVGFTMDLAQKDLGFALRLAHDAGLELDLAERTAERFRIATQRYGGDAQSTRVVQLLEDAAGRTLRAPGFPERLG